MEKDINKKKESIDKENRSYDEMIPNYEHLFNDNENKPNKKNGILKRLIKVNFGSLFSSTIVYFFQNLPVWVLPIATANIIDITGEAIKAGELTQTSLILLIVNLSVLLITTVLNIPFTVLRWRIVSKMLRKTSAGLKSVLIRKLQHLSITYHKDMQSGKIQSKFLRDIESIDGLLQALVFSFIPNLIGVIISSAISIYRNGFVALFFLIIIPINVLLTFLFRKKIKDTNKDFRVKTEDMSAKLSTMIEMTPVTKSHGLQDVEIASLNKTIANVTRSGMGVDNVHAYFGSLSFVVSNVLNIGCLVFCIFLAIRGIISVGDIVLYQSMFTTISNGITGLIGILPQITKGTDALSSVSEIMNVTEVERSIDNPKPININGDVEFKNVTYQYPNGKVNVVSDFSLDVKKGECVAFVGSSGSGKTTIMNLIIGLLLPTSGDLLIDGISIKEYDLQSYRHNISVVPQNSILFTGTIRDNITYGLERYTEEELNKVVEMANISEFIKDLPDGLNTQVGEHGDKLSGGQKQRITIARALIRNPKILILDEATSALDNISEYYVQKAISASVSGRTTFIVAHRLSTIRNADKIVVMDNGRCVETGTYEELMAKKGKFYELKELNDLNTKLANDALS